jgi:hypothetical protein
MALLRDRSIPAVLSHLDLTPPGIKAPTPAAPLPFTHLASSLGNLRRN